METWRFGALRSTACGLAELEGGEMWQIQACPFIFSRTHGTVLLSHVSSPLLYLLSTTYQYLLLDLFSGFFAGHFDRHLYM